MLAIIPARGGSKGVPFKNIKNLGSHPLIYYTIKAAKESKLITRIIVSTDDQDIADIGLKEGVEVPFLRPKELASDKAKAIDNYIYTIEKINETEKASIDEFVVLQPTSPFRDSSDIDNAIEIFRQKKATSVISVVEAEHPPFWYKKVDRDGVLKDLLNGENSLNRQEYLNTYIPNGAIYIFDYNTLKNRLSYYTEKTYPYIMSKEKSVDIDTFLDFDFAEFMLIHNANI